MFPILTAAEPVGGEEHFEEVIQPFVKTYCWECHQGEDRKSDIDLGSVTEPAAFIEDEDLLDLFLWVLEDESMPPRDAKQPPQEQIEALMTWLDAQLRAGKVDNDPGVVAMPRLTRVEYGNVIRDLTGIRFDARPHLPAEGGAGEGFSNVGEGQLMSVGELEQFLNTAKAVTQHLRAIPGMPLEWHDAPLDDVKYPDELRQEMVQRWKAWHILEQERRKERFNKLEENYDMTDGVYMEAVWMDEHRDTLGLPSETTLEDLAENYDPPLSPSVLRLWKKALQEQKAERQIMKEFFERWNNIGGPDELKDVEALRAELVPLEEWIQNWGRLIWDLRYSNVEDRRYLTGDELRTAVKKGVHPMRVTFEDVESKESPLKKLYFVATDMWDNHDDDVPVWRNGQFLFGDKKDPRKEPWHEKSGGWKTLEGEPVAWGSHPDGAQLEPGAVGVLAPQVLVLDVPEDAIGLEFEAFVDLEKYPQATVQQFVTHDLSELDRFEHFNTLRFIPRRTVIHAPDSEELKDFEQAVAEAEEFMELERRNGMPAVFWVHDVTGVDLDYLPVQYGGGVEREMEDIGSAPYKIAPEDLRVEAAPEDRYECDDLLGRLKASIQQPHQQLVKLLKENGYQKAVEGVIPPEEVTADWENAAKERFEELAYTVKGMEMQNQRYARQQLGAFARKAWRREIAEEDMETIMRLYRENRAQGNIYDTAIKHALHFVLVSPKFLYRIQEGQDSPEPYALNSFELADRLAFFLWASVPDQELLELAQAGKLTDPEVLRAQARRMLADDRARALGEAFAGQWMGFYNFRSFTDPDGEAYPQYTEELRLAMFEESVRFFTHIFQEGRPLTEIITADYSFLNETLAEHYGISGVNGEELRKVTLPEDKPRGGVLTQGSFLTGTSMPLRTSPVNRGVWILETILGEHLPAPPPNVPPLSDEQVSTEGLTIPEQLARHREDPACMNCHIRIDPLGLSLEQFDPIGSWREEYPGGAPVDPAGQDAEGTPIEGVQGLIDYLMARDEKVLRQFNRKLLGFALGRGVEKSDDPLLDDMLDALEENDNKFIAALEVVVSSPQFRFRRDNPDLALNNSELSTPDSQN